MCLICKAFAGSQLDWHRQGRKKVILFAEGSLAALQREARVTGWYGVFSLNTPWSPEITENLLLTGGNRGRNNKKNDIFKRKNKQTKVWGRWRHVLYLYLFKTFIESYMSDEPDHGNIHVSLRSAMPLLYYLKQNVWMNAEFSWQTKRWACVFAVMDNPWNLQHQLLSSLYCNHWLTDLTRLFL